LHNDHSEPATSRLSAGTTSLAVRRSRPGRSPRDGECNNEQESRGLASSSQGPCPGRLSRGLAREGEGRGCWPPCAGTRPRSLALAICSAKARRRRNRRRDKRRKGMKSHPRAPTMADEASTTSNDTRGPRARRKGGAAGRTCSRGWRAAMGARRSREAAARAGQWRGFAG
jgi:hypothetical protein